MDTGLPVDLFLNEPNLTPQRYLPFADQQDVMTAALAREKAEEQVADTFGNVRDEVLDPFTDAYLDAEANVAEAKKEGRSAEGIKFPEFVDLAAVAKKYNLNHEVSPLLDQEEPRITEGSRGPGPGRVGPAPATTSTTRCLTPSRVSMRESSSPTPSVITSSPASSKTHPRTSPPLDEVRDQVVRAWKIAQARPLARKAADDYAAQLRTEGGVIKNLTVDNRP